MKISESYQLAIETLKERLDSDDVTFMNCGGKTFNAVLVFINSLVDKKAIGDLILKPLNLISEKPDKEKLSSIFLSPETKDVYDTDEIISEINNGNSVLIVENISSAFSFALVKFEKRAIAEPPTSNVIKGPREGFVENLTDNLSMMRRRIKSDKLKIETFNVGDYSNTQVALLYVKGVCDNKLVDKLRKKIHKIDIDAVLDSSYVSKFLGEHKTSVFKQIGNTEKPDILTSKIMEGRVAIIVDGSPIALTVPYLLIEDFQSPSDYYTSNYTATLARVIRIFAVIVSLLLPALFISAELFHLQLIPLSFLLTIVNSIKGIPLSPSYEMFFTLLIFEILNEASVRMPRYVGMVVSIVGGLVLGETAVNAGIISAPVLMIIAFSGICLYTVPELVHTFSLIRILFLIIGGSLGAYGLILCSVGIVVYLVSFENYGTPLTAPYSPLIKEDLKDGIYKGFVLGRRDRPISIKHAKIQDNQGENDETT